MSSISAVTFGCAAAWLIAWALKLRTASNISARARAQLGLRPEIVEDARTRPSLSRSTQRRLLAGVALSAIAIATIGPLGAVISIFPAAITRAINKRSARKRQRALDDALAPALQRIIAQLSVGRTISSAIEASIEHASAPLDGIFRRVISDHNVGIALDESLSPKISALILLTTGSSGNCSRHLSILINASSFFI